MLFARKKGMSMIEILFAIAILSVGVLAVMGLFPAIFKLNTSSSLTVSALFLAQEKMDEILATGKSISTTEVAEEMPQLPQGQRFRVGSDDPNGDPDIQMITVRVTWREKSRSRSVVLKSLISP
ncbi:MAG: prepilin-type N-terminal cleavage/methylation domain-containing protein [bacterium]